jgi:hypothetical protein
MFEAKKRPPGRGVSPEAPLLATDGVASGGFCATCRAIAAAPFSSYGETRLSAGRKIHETVQPSATGGRLAPIAAREVDHC